MVTHPETDGDKGVVCGGYSDAYAPPLLEKEGKAAIPTLVSPASRGEGTKRLRQERSKSVSANGLPGLSLRWYAEVLGGGRWLTALAQLAVRRRAPPRRCRCVLGTLAALGLARRRGALGRRAQAADAVADDRAGDPDRGGVVLLPRAAGADQHLHRPDPRAHRDRRAVRRGAGADRARIARPQPGARRGGLRRARRPRPSCASRCRPSCRRWPPARCSRSPRRSTTS